MPRIPKNNLGSYFCKGQRIANENLRSNWDSIFGERKIPSCPNCGSTFGTDTSWKHISKSKYRHRCPDGTEYLLCGEYMFLLLNLMGVLRQPSRIKTVINLEE